MDSKRALLVAAALPLVLTAAPAPAAAAAACPVVIAHKTAGGDAPENTVPGIAVARSLGVTTVEIDIRFNKSNFAFAIHNETVDITTNGTGRVAEMYMPALQKLSAADYAPGKRTPATAASKRTARRRSECPTRTSFWTRRRSPA